MYNHLKLILVVVIQIFSVTTISWSQLNVSSSCIESKITQLENLELIVKNRPETDKDIFEGNKALMIEPISAQDSCKVSNQEHKKECQEHNLRQIDVQELKNRMANKDFFLVNVHVPYAGDLPDTDISIPYNKVMDGIEKFPKDKDAKIILYCRSGHMSLIAAKKLTEFGYSNVLNVTGGIKAWEAAGLQIITIDQE